MGNQGNLEKPIKIAVVGDVHDQWEDDDGYALQQMGVDLVLFVGDFGNESVSVVRAIASLDIPKAAVFGNHDAWYTTTDWGRNKCPYDRKQEDWVQQQMDLLGKADVGYGKLDFPELNLSVVGGRPFSWGGSKWKYADFWRDRFGVTSFAESSSRIVAAAHESAYDTVIFIGHNGPTGLGDKAEDPCGKDWGEPLGGDFGDPDLADAIAQTRASGKSIPLVTFGHMHHKLRHTKERLREAISVSSEGTVYLNAASVPRIIQSQNNRLRNFSLVSLEAGVVTQASLAWIDKDFSVASEEILYRRTEPVVQPVSIQ
jgi:uncharacterized protein (TIGR04168 family)